MTEAGKLPPPLPPRLDWFVHTQMGQLAQDGVPKWFHGAISREDAENLLESQPLGSFLIRVSHSHVGYTLSYKAQSCCRHFMVKLLDDGRFVMPGEMVAHASLDDLVTFHQQKPIDSHGELLTQPCGQSDPENVDYEDLFLYSYTLAEEATSPARDPREHQRPSSCPVAAPKEAPAKPVLLDRPKESKPLTEMDGGPTEDAPSSCPPKAPFGDAHQKLWRNLKTLPQRGKRVQQQLKSQLTAVSLSSLWDARSTVTHGSGARAGSRQHPGTAAHEDNVRRDPFAATFLKSPSQPQAPRDRNVPSRKTKRSVSWDKVTPEDSSWHQSVARLLSFPGSRPEPRGGAEPQEEWLPEEYRPPPPFAPGYC
ncbi:PREDICTED: hematopoietic SH2 domain-containing protein [Propithecus coquereli]|uniref:hematopoietic SH2 domain-containing protein n=1 Tax=Propithecus coquereli TaxID=379532 RepID=UPI00063FBB45|nr:PREDICTED: hematopoietic SH2 domain-containing protein [Propithecus coquereli]